MYYFSNTSKQNLRTCHAELQLICKQIIQVMDFSVLCGFRPEEEQNAAYLAGNSAVLWPHSKHNTYPSLAVDIAPYPIDWDNIERFRSLGELFLHEAAIRRIRIFWGAWWEKPKDYPHFEIIL